MLRISAAASATHELDLDWGDFGAFGRVFYFYDAAVMDIDPDRTDFTADANAAVGVVWGGSDVTDWPLFRRAGEGRMGYLAQE